MLYSHSRLSTFEQCPYKFKLQYIDKVPPPDEETTIEAFMGKLVHEALEKLYEEMEEGPIALQELLDFYDREWEERWDPEDIRIVKDRPPEEYKKEGREFIEQYYEEHHPFDEDEVVGIEDRVVIELEDGYRLQGYIDRLSYDPETETFKVHDYKTGSWLPSRHELENDRQLALYSIAVREEHDTDRVKLVWHFLAHGEDVELEKDEEELEEVKDKTTNLIKQIEREDEFEPQTSALCAYCEYRSICPEWEHVAEVEENGDGTEGMELVDRYVELEDEMDELREEKEELEQELKEFADAKGFNVLAGSEHKARIDASGIEIPDGKQEELEALLKEHGVWEDVSRLDEDLLKEIISHYPRHPNNNLDTEWEPWPQELVVELAGLLGTDDRKKVRIEER